MSVDVVTIQIDSSVVADNLIEPLDRGSETCFVKRTWIGSDGERRIFMAGLAIFQVPRLFETVGKAGASIVFGLVAALLATLLGTVFGSVAGYFGGRIDDFFNWFYSIFTSIPYLLLTLSVAAVLQQKGITTIILILSLTGWTGPFRLIRAEYMKHKAREYVMAAEAFGASHYRKSFIHFFPHIRTLALVPVSILFLYFI